MDRCLFLRRSNQIKVNQTGSNQIKLKTVSPAFHPPHHPSSIIHHPSSPFPPSSRPNRSNPDQTGPNRSKKYDSTAPTRRAVAGQRRVRSYSQLSAPIRSYSGDEIFSWPAFHAFLPRRSQTKGGPRLKYFLLHAVRSPTVSKSNQKSPTVTTPLSAPIRVD